MKNILDKIEILQTDITKLKVDAIVNAANSSLMGGGGVDGAIHRAGGASIVEECKIIVAKQGRCPTGESVITGAGKMPAKYVIHTVGPVWNGGNNKEADKLKSCYINSLRLALEYNCKTIAFPNISTGIYSYPKKEAAQIAVKSVAEFLEQNDEIDKVYFVCFENDNYRYTQEALGKITGL